MQPVVIETVNLSKFYGQTRGIESVNLTITRGELFGFLGPNGAGKSTTIRCLLHFLRPTQGKVYLFGNDISSSYYDVFRRIGNVPGELKLYEELDGQYLLDFMNGFNRLDSPLRTDLIESFQFSPEDLSRKIKHYSRGMKQKLLIIQALQEAPDLIVMDEASEGLDPLNKNILYDWLLKLKDKGSTIFFSSHNLSEVEKLCDRVGLIKDGQMIAIESIASLKKKMIRKMEIEFRDRVDPEILKAPGVENIKQEGDKYIVHTLGDINILLRHISQHRIKNLVFPEPSLEEMFMHFYRGDKKS